MKTNEIIQFVEDKKAEGFSPTQVKGQLAMQGVPQATFLPLIGTWRVAWHGRGRNRTFTVSES